MNLGRYDQSSKREPENKIKPERGSAACSRPLSLLQNRVSGISKKQEKTPLRS